jgi:hypothetical protein
MHGFLSNLFAGPATMAFLVAFTLGMGLLVRALVLLLVKTVSRSVTKKRSVRGSIPFVSIHLSGNEPGAASSSSETLVSGFPKNRFRSEYNKN